MPNWLDLKDNLRLKRIFEQRMKIIRAIREFFWAQGFVETETPIAVKNPSQEPYLNFVPVTFHGPRGEAYKFYLQTSPEYGMKKLLAAGWGKIFQICKCFRDFEEFGGRHNTEFTMIEWYRAPGVYQEIMDDTENLFKFVSNRLFGEIQATDWPAFAKAMAGKWERLSMKEIWKKFVGVELDEYLSVEKMSELARAHGYNVEKEDAYEDVFYKIFLNEIEPKLGIERPVFVYDYPAQMTSLSRLCKDHRYAERFELYIGGLEMANAFGELTDADEQLRLLEADKKHRKELGKETWPVDGELISALKSGIPNAEMVASLPAASQGASAAGIALGVDRMVLLFTEAGDLNETIFQSVKDQLE